MSGNTASRHVNGILGLLCRRHFPGMVMHVGNLEPAFTFAHYESAPPRGSRHRGCARHSGVLGKSSSHYMAQYNAFIGLYLK